MSGANCHPCLGPLAGSRLRRHRVVTSSTSCASGLWHWVVANPKETELTYVRPGQAALLTVDTYPDTQWGGAVESVSPAAAQEFSLLPAQNTSGNWVKVVERIPMRVRVDTSNKSLPPLRAGMSVEVDVDTGHTRGLPHFLTALFGHHLKGRCCPRLAL